MDHSPWRLLYYHFTVTFSVLLSALLNILHHVFRRSAQIKKKNLQQSSVCTQNTLFDCHLTVNLLLFFKLCLWFELEPEQDFKKY